MDGLLTSGSALVAVSLGYLAYTGIAAPGRVNARIETNLKRGLTGHEEVGAPKAPLLARLGAALTPGAYVKRLDRLLSLAGRPSSMPLERLLAAKPTLGLVGLIAAVLLWTNGSAVL
ncbi:type II secretion system F family protein, partial [Vibrio cholerae]|nr:type II secretion system F family protein [Vibrio cholerae]